MFRVGLSVVVGGIVLAALSGCGQSTAADQNRQPHARLTINDDDHPNHWSTLKDTTLTKCRQRDHLYDNVLCAAHRHGAVNRLLVESCQPADTPNHTTVCVESRPVRVKSCDLGHPRHGVVCVEPRRSN